MNHEHPPRAFAADSTAGYVLAFSDVKVHKQIQRSELTLSHIVTVLVRTAETVCHLPRG